MRYSWLILLLCLNIILPATSETISANYSYNSMEYFSWRLWTSIGIIISVIAGILAWLNNKKDSKLNNNLNSKFTIETIPDVTDAIPTLNHIVQLPPTLSQPNQAIRLTIISGSMPKGQFWDLQLDTPILIGSSESCTVAIYKDTDISNQHAQIEMRNQHCIVININSAPCSFVNGVPVYQERLLENGDIL
ncbi:hypothetical protein TI05_17990, partial [Achromatium sp. WMS3]